jgi:hypothetical protein
MRPATTEEWVNAVTEAHTRLCVGMDCHVYTGKRETWEGAIIRVAGGLLRFHGLGRERGKVPDEWYAIAFSAADRSSSSPDGLVAGPRGLRLAIRSLQRARREGQGGSAFQIH